MGRDPKSPREGSAHFGEEWCELWEGLHRISDFPQNLPICIPVFTPSCRQIHFLIALLRIYTASVPVHPFSVDPNELKTSSKSNDQFVPQDLKKKKQKKHVCHGASCDILCSRLHWFTHSLKSSFKNPSAPFQGLSTPETTPGVQSKSYTLILFFPERLHWYLQGLPLCVISPGIQQVYKLEPSSPKGSGTSHSQGHNSLHDALCCHGEQGQITGLAPVSG